MNGEQIVLDTNIVSFLFKGDALAELYRPHLEGRKWCVSFVTVAELHFGARKDAWTAEELDKFLADSEISVLAHNYHTSLEWAKIRSELGRKVSDNDVWIAASARVRGIPLITHDQELRDIPGLEIIIESGG